MTAQQTYELSNEALMVRNALIACGLESPYVENSLSSEEKKSIIEEKFSQIMSTMGLDLNDDSLSQTPKRVAKMFIDEIFSGLDY